MRTLRDIIFKARDEFERHLRDAPVRKPHDELIHDIAVRAIPVYTGDLMHLATDNPRLLDDKRVYDAIYDNLYWEVEEALWETWAEFQSKVKR